MTRTEYADYESRIAAFIEREKLSFLSTGTAETCGGEQGDAWFSFTPCECCGDKLGGMREYLFARSEADALRSVVRFTICEDCVYYVAYGRLDDSTMLQIEREVTP